MNYLRGHLPLTAALILTTLSLLATTAIVQAAEPAEPVAQAASGAAPAKPMAAKPTYPLRVRLGQFFPDSKSQRRGLGSVDSIGVDYDYFQNNLFGGLTTVSFYAELDNGERFGRRNSAEFSLNTLGFGAEVRRILADSVDKRHFYFGAAAGIYRTQYIIDPTGPARYDKSQVGLGLKLLVGYQFDKRFFVQLDTLTLNRYSTRNSNGIPLRVEPSGSRLYLGYRF